MRDILLFFAAFCLFDLMTKAELLEKANGLPLTPGVYIMKNKSGAVIYVGKSKVLRQRVSQYFADIEHSVKTQKMADTAFEFEYMLTDTEMEALALENRLIKLHQPKYNIKLKDAKSYPYVKVSLGDEYPKITVVRKRENDGARYFGPYSSMSTAYAIIRTAQRTFRIPNCKKEFPRDIGKERPCIYKQLGQCVAPCSGEVTSEEYKEIFRDIMPFLRGSFNSVRDSLNTRMEDAAENLMFENAALFRDRIKALDKLLEKQKAVGAPDADQDVFALYTDERCSCLAVFYIRMGFVADSEHFIFPPEQIADSETLSAFIGDLYNKRSYIPKEILIGFSLDEENGDALYDYLRDIGGRMRIRYPERGDLRALCDMVAENARIQAEQYLAETDRDNKMLVRLARLLALEVVPQRIEAFDISNMGSDCIVAGMVVAEDGKFRKSAYRTYNIRDTEGQDDYASMREAVSRRLAHTGDMPDLILLDGGRGHVSTIRRLLEEMGINIPVFGMVKDEFHKTRALSSDSEDISIAREQAVFNFIYKLQEEVHRYTITRMSDARSRAVKRSSLEDITGIGPAKAKALLAHFKTIGRIKAASVEEIAEAEGIGGSDAERVYGYFHPAGETPDGDS